MSAGRPGAIDRTRPNGLAVAPDGRSVHVSNFESDTLSVIDTATDRTVATVPVGDGPTGVAH
ncbi:hypothetical protein ADK53_04210 [Streptomyces sp. WM6373]|uniref:hypothetical protein n=1 Tax=Streptomyces TaxID=1883 RepID=UPI0006B007D5|nr:MULTISPECIES: hypothetical protein [unclassified Streptomyces]KOU43875.1 hypothetical protein ADK53_04210 [Streptomyces sp. WM6373]KOU74851.1 hypothetical protein ADK96_03740 [Streptomyces sp. IGB124]KOU88296.1 hypothetical protein ADK61_03500 [Streptomyces sp. XY66]KOU97993.1 hypothetical protein ADK93_02230 [Streptomyces sp. XY58]KOV06726.1 hypothetical protein ADK89_13530 [Streptomyces sp. XY37]